ncbi:MAG: hypothetical protein KF788_02250 [Piscinibacter sp.]|nr:hypothetical protein [Piscinibacter sp.]
MTLVDEDDADRHDANEACELPAPNLPLGDTGLTVEDFLARWRDGSPGLDSAARLYGRLLYRKLLQEPSDLAMAWQQAMQAARARATGVRLEIRCPLDQASRWRDLALPALPFELMCDEQGYLFRRPGWSTVRRSRGMRSRQLRWQTDPSARARVQVAWANVQRPAQPPLDEALFLAHDRAVEMLAGSGRAERLTPLPAATRQALADALQQGKPHVLVWIGHGLDSGSGLLLHDDGLPGYPGDPGCVVAAGDFAAAVREGAVDLALLWSCHGAGTFRALDAGVAEALLDPDRGDVAAVLASFSALDAAAVARLSKDLIEAWAHGDGDLEAALARARARLDELSLTWARPVLFLRTPPADPSPRLPAKLAEVPALQPDLAGRLRWLPALPAHTARYVDHLHRLAQLCEDLAHHPVVVLEGLPGAGKTELALALAHELRASNHDVAFVDLSGQPSLGPLRQTLGLLVSAAPFDDDGALLAALAGRRWTLVLDNAEDLLGDETLRRDLLRLLAALRASSDGFLAVVTSRHALARAGTAEAQALFSREHRLLEPAESLELFIAAAGPRLAPAQATSSVLTPLLRELGGIPRAIVLMAGQLGAEVDVPELCRRLAALGTEAIVEDDLFGEALPASLDRRLHKSRLASALRLSLASAARHADAAYTLFDVLGTFPAGLLQALLPRAEENRLGDALTALLDHHLVQLVGDERRILMAAPVRAWAVRRWEEQAAAEDARALLDHVFQRLGAYVSALDDDLGTSRAQAARLRFLAEAANVVQAIQWRARSPSAEGGDDLAASLFRSAALFAVHGGTARSSLLELGKLADQLAGGKTFNSAATVAFYLGQLKMRTDDLAGARQAYEQALPIYRQIEDRLGEANALQSVGRLSLADGDAPTAFSWMVQALGLQRQTDDRLGMAGTHGYLARIAAQAGAVDLAIVHGTRAWRTLVEVGDRFGQMLALTDLGQVVLQRDVQQGLALLLLARAAALAIDDPRAEWLAGLVAQFRADGASEEGFAAALAALQAQAVQIAQDLCTAADAAVERGELDPWTLPVPRAGGDDAA